MERIGVEWALQKLKPGSDTIDAVPCGHRILRYFFPFSAA